MVVIVFFDNGGQVEVAGLHLAAVLKNGQPGELIQHPEEQSVVSGQWSVVSGQW